MSIQVNSNNSSNPLADLTANSRVPQQALGQDDFLKLLVTQMTSQDPLNPGSDAGFITQMAQFSALGETGAMESDISQLRIQQQLSQASAMLGQTVKVQATADTTATGVVTAIQLDSGTPQIVIGGTAYDLSQVLTIQTTQTAPVNTRVPIVVPDAPPAVIDQQTTQASLLK